MKRVWVNLLLLCLSVSLFGQSYERLYDYEMNTYGKKLHVSGSFEAMKQVRGYWTKEFSRLKGYDQYEMCLCGNGESVLKITMPVNVLFQSNDSILSIQSIGLLRPLLRLLRDESKASLVVACYSDNNGSTRYLEKITLVRAQAICDWMQGQGVPSRITHAFGMGNHVPLNENSNMAERQANRRVTFYLVPSKQMMKQAKRKKLI